LFSTGLHLRAKTKLIVYRFAYITWIGDNVPGVTKARVGTNKAAVTELVGVSAYHYRI